MANSTKRIVRESQSDKPVEANNSELSTVPGHNPAFDKAYVPLTVDELRAGYPNAVSVAQARRLHRSGVPIRTTPLNHEERCRVIEAPWPTVNIWDSGKSWGGTTKRESIIPDSGARSWSRAGYGDGDATDD